MMNNVIAVQTILSFLLGGTYPVA